MLNATTPAQLGTGAAGSCRELGEANSGFGDQGPSLQLTIDRLSTTLSKTEEEENQQKDKVQSLNMTLSDSNATINGLQDRIAQLQRGLTSSEHDRRILQERLDTTRIALGETKKENQAYSERLHLLQNDVGDNDVARAELEGQIRQTHSMLVKHQESEQEQNHRIQKLQQEKQNLQEQLVTLKRNSAELQTAKREMERSHIRQEKDKWHLKKHLISSLDRSMQRFEDENGELAKHIQELQSQLAEAEQQHAQRLIDLTTRHRAETEMETERLRTAQLQAERLLDTRRGLTDRRSEDSRKW
ncbi:hypothetical protein ScPMuIL_008314 [Solemya velum]